MPDFEQTEQDFQNHERGTARLAVIRDAIREADNAQDHHWRFWFRYDYIEESVFCGDRYYAVIAFPEMLELYDKTPQLHEENYTHSMMVCFRWIVEAVEEFPQISKAQIDAYFRDFKRRLREYGYSLNIYYMKRSTVYMHMDLDAAMANFYRFLDEPIDSISDGKGLCQSHQVDMYLHVGEEEKALRAAEPIFSGKLKAASLPYTTYHKFACYYLHHGDIVKAEEYLRPILQRIEGDPYLMNEVGTAMSIYSVLDPEKALRFFRTDYPLYLASKNPWERNFFVFGACHLFARIAKDSLPLDGLVVPPGAPIEAALAANDRKAIAEHFYQEAVASAKKFDTRNGTDDYMGLLHDLPVTAD